MSTGSVNGRMNPPTLRQRVMLAGSWVLGGHAASQVIRLGSNIVLTRLLSPDTFGLMAVVYVMMVGLALFSDLGINVTVVRSTRGQDPDFLDTAWTLQVLRGVILTVLSLVLASGFALAAHWGLAKADTVYADERLPWVVAAFSLVALIGGLESIRVGLSKRNMEMHLMTRLEVTSQLVSAGVMITVAWITHSIWALVLGAIIAGALRCGLGHAWLPGHRERFRLEPSAVRELMGNAKWIFASSILGFIAVNGDRMVLGGLIDTKVFGLYAIAFLLVNTLQVVASMLCMNVAYPAISEVFRDRPSDLPETIVKFQWAYDGLVTTLAATLIMGGPAIVHVLYDSRYQEAGWMLTTLAIGAIGLRYQLVEQCYQAVGKPQYYTLANFIRLIALVAGIVIGHRYWGLEGAITGIALSQFSTWPLALWFKARYQALSWRAEMMIVPAVLGGLALGSGLTWLVATFFPLRAAHL